MSHGISLSHSLQDLKLESYDYELPPHLIAERPVAGRHHSRLLVYDENADTITHTTFKEIGNFLPGNSTIVFNQSRVFPCRFLGHKETGGKVEVFLLRFESNNGFYPALIKSGSKKQIGDEYTFSENLKARVEASVGDGTFLLSFNQEITLTLLERVALVPIPPYIREGKSDERDLKDYQTVYAKTLGSVAAPTAGLHFSNELLSDLESRGIKRSHVTLHVGMGTFAPVKSENILEHKMHSEEFFVTESDYQKIKEASSTIAVGTTTLRVLESIHGTHYQGQALSTDIFLYPGKEVKSIQGLVTNFHLPKSTLLMLVSALIGREKVLEIYREAVAHEYRFFSYGDAMLILRKSE